MLFLGAKRGLAVAVAAVAGLAMSQPASAAILTDFETGFTNVVDASDNPISPRWNGDNIRFARWIGASNRDVSGYTGPVLDLVAELTIPAGSADTSASLLGLEGAGIYWRPPATADPYTITYTFVESGTNTPFVLDELHVGYLNIEQVLGSGQLGDENVYITGASFAEIGKKIEVKEVDPATGSFRLDPLERGSGNPDGLNRAKVIYTNTATFTTNYRLSSPAALGFLAAVNVTGGDRAGIVDPQIIDFRSPGGSPAPGPDVVPEPMTASLAAFGLLGAAWVGSRRSAR